MQTKASAKIGFVMGIAENQCIGFVADRLHHRIDQVKMITLRLLRAGLGVRIRGLQQVCSAHPI